MYDVEFYVLGLLRFDKENVGKSVILSKGQLNQIQKYLGEKIGRTSEERDLWQVWSLPGESECIKKIKGILSKHKVSSNDIQCELGYYHHRVIFKLHLRLPKDRSLAVLREIRDNLHCPVRELLNEALLNKKIESDGEKPECLISYIYTYPLTIVYNGAKLVKETRGDRTFCPCTTTFFFEIPEVKYHILLRSHFVRISIPGTIVYADKKLDNSIFWELINGIYYAALYSKKLQDIENLKSAQKDETLNELNERILRELSSYLIEGIVALEKQEIGNRLAWIALIVSVMSILLSTIPNIIPFIFKIIELIIN